MKKHLVSVILGALLIGGFYAVAWGIQLLFDTNPVIGLSLIMLPAVYILGRMWYEIAWE